MKLNYNGGVDISRYLMSVDEILDMIKNLKKRKASGLDNLTTEHLCNSHPIIAHLLTKLFNMMIIFVYLTNASGRGILIPIPKTELGKNDLKSDNYRGISLNPVISKLFEQCLLVIFERYLCSSSMQFGFKARSSCSHAIYSVRKTIEFFVERNSTVNVCALDL
jgi:hypothetical protein